MSQRYKTFLISQEIHDNTMNTAMSTSYFCAVPLLEDIRALDHIGQAKVCEAFAKWLDRNPNVDSMFIERFRETFSIIDCDKPDESVELIHYAVNDLDSALTFIDYRSPMDFLELAGSLAPVIAEAKAGRGR